MRRFFTEQPLTVDSDIQLCDQSFHHWIRVLRAKAGDKATLFNGGGGEYRVQLTDITKKHATVYVDSYHPVNRDNPFKVTLAIVMSKGDRMDYALQKATELGVHDIQLLTSDHCEVKLTGERLHKKLKNWQGIITSACEQCGLNIPPKIHSPISIAKFTESANHELKLVLAPTESGQANMPFTTPLPEHICIVIGAEGGLTTDEIDLATQHRFMPWCLGERILRTETAPVSAISMLLASHTFRTRDA